MNTKKLFLCIFILYISVYSLHASVLKKIVYGDGIYYFAWLRSIIVDHDVSFDNEYRNYGVSQPQTVTHKTRNIYSIGPAIIWLPGYAFIYEIIRGTGYEFVYEFTTGLSSVFYSLVGLVLVHRLLLKKFSVYEADVAIAGIALATNLLFYGAVDPINSHAPTFLASVLFISFVMDLASIYSFAVGFCYGLIGLIRMQDLIYGAFVIKFLKKLSILYFAAGFMVIMLPQLVVWKYFQGSFVTSPYFGEKLLFFRPFSPAVLQVLFSPLNGLLLWTPVLLFAITGLIRAAIKRNAQALTMLTVILLQLYVVSIRNEWWQEASYSGRMFVSVLPLLAFGLAYWTKWILSLGAGQKIIYAAIWLLSFLNAILIVLYLLLHT